MKRLFFLVIVLCLLVSGCATPARNIVFQTSTIDALLAGVYDGEMTCGNLQQHGNFGIGTFDHLDGEMVLLDGNMYQIKADGRVYLPGPAVKTPFATVCQFKADKTVVIKRRSDYETMESLIDEHAPDQNLFCAIKITGQFRSVRTRSVPGQRKPYPPLNEVTSNQPEFRMERISGTIVGFRCPPYVKGINVPGYHLHFISTDRTRGGHVLSFEITDGECEIDILNQYLLVLPTHSKG